MESCENGKLIHPEMEVLLWAIRVDGYGDDRIRKLLNSEVDWSKLLQEAKSQRVITLLYERLKDLHENCVSTEMNLELRNLCRSVEVRNLMHVRQLLLLVQILSNQGVRVIPFKGVVLSQQVYGSPLLRQSGDIDILIAHDDLPTIIEAFQNVGFYPDILSSKKFLHSLICSIMQCTTFSSSQYTHIDAHWDISDIFSGYPAKNKFLQNSQTIKIFESYIPTLSPEDTLILLSAHGVKHFWPNLQLLADIIHLLHENPDLDILLALSKAERLRCKRILHISLHMANVMGGIKYSNAIQNILDLDPVSRKIALDFIEFFKYARKPEPIPRLFTMFRSREHIVDAFRFSMYALFSCPPPTRCNIRLPRPLRPVYILLK
jgi:hypothetical protein